MLEILKETVVGENREKEMKIAMLARSLYKFVDRNRKGCRGEALRLVGNSSVFLKDGIEQCWMASRRHSVVVF